MSSGIQFRVGNFEPSPEFLMLSPPENISGIWGYEGFTNKTLRPPTWIVDDFDAQAFELDKMNEQLKRIK